jgi:hypothetical protein
MAKTKISEFDSTPANNTDIDSINIAEGCAPSGINNAIRELMSQLKDQQTGASGDNFTVGGNLSVTGTSTHTGAATFAGATTFTGAVVMSTALPIASGGTGSSTAGGARANLSVAASGANSDITSITGLTTALTVAQGGTGAATHTSKGVLIGNGTSAITTVSPGTTGNVLKSDGTNWTSAAPSSQYIKAWAFLDGSATSPITSRDSFNIASITRTGTGVYDVVFTTAMATSNYAVIGSANNSPTSAGHLVPPAFGTSMTANGFTFNTYNSNFSTLVNATNISFTIIAN